MIKLTYDGATQIADIELDANGLNMSTDEGLETAVTISLFTDARAKDGDDVDPGIDKRGWWGEAYLEPRGQLGSRLWQLKRAKITQETLTFAKAWAEEGLAWLVTVGIAASVVATVTRLTSEAIKLTIEITRPQKIKPKWQHTWEVQLDL